MPEYIKQTLLHKNGDSEIWVSADGDLKVIERIFFHKSGLMEIYRALLEVRQENLPQILELQETDTGFTVIEEHIEGVPVSDLLQGGKIFSQKECRSYALQLCAALKALHEKQIVHRDVKPGNLMITESGCLKLIDFGAARFFDVRGDKDTRLLGTEGYAAPEQYGFTQTDFRADIYAFGVTLQEMQPPAKAMGLQKILAKCVRIDPGKRYQSIRALERALKNPLASYAPIILAAAVCLAAGAFLLTASTGQEKLTVEEAVESAAENLTEAQMMKMHYWTYPSEGASYTYLIKESCFNDLFLTAPYGDADDLYLLRSTKKVKEITFSGADAAVFSCLKMREFKERGEWFTKLQFQKHLPSNEGRKYTAEGLVTFEDGQTLPFQCVAELQEDFNPAFNMPYTFYEGLGTEVTVYVWDNGQERDYSYSWQILEGKENAGFASVPGGPNDFVVNRKPASKKTDTITVYGRKPGSFVLQCYVTGLVDGQPLTWGCMIDDAKVRPVAEPEK